MEGRGEGRVHKYTTPTLTIVKYFRFKKIMRLGKLKQLEANQEKEITRLKEELKKMQLATYPTLANNNPQF